MESKNGDTIMLTTSRQPKKTVNTCRAAGVFNLSDKAIFKGMTYLGGKDTPPLRCTKRAGRDDGLPPSVRLSKTRGAVAERFAELTYFCCVL